MPPHANVRRTVLPPFGSLTRTGVCLAALVVLAVAPVLVSCAAGSRTEGLPEAVEISVAITHSPGCTPVLVALDEGYFAEEGLDVTIQQYSSGRDAVRVMLDGEADLATAGDTPVARAALLGEPLSVLAGLAETNGAHAIITRRQTGITSFAELAGKRVGAPQWTSGHFYLHVAQTASYLGKRVEHVDLAPEESLDALLAGRVDAISIWSPYNAQIVSALGEDAVVLDVPELYTQAWTLAGSQSFCDENPQAVRAFLRALIRATEAMERSPALAQAAYGAHVGEAFSSEPVDWTHYAFSVELEQSLLLELEDQMRWMREESPDTSLADLDRLVDEAPLLDVAPEAVRAVGRQS